MTDNKNIFFNIKIYKIRYLKEKRRRENNKRKRQRIRQTHKIKIPKIDKNKGSKTQMTNTKGEASKKENITYRNKRLKRQKKLIIHKIKHSHNYRKKKKKKKQRTKV